MTRPLLALALLIGAFAPLSARAEKFYVAADGKDGATASKARPVKSIQVAIDLALKANRAPVHSIEIGPGTYTVTQPIVANLRPGLHLLLHGSDPSKPPVLDGSSLPKPADVNVTNESLLRVNGGSVTIDNLAITHTSGHGVWIEHTRPFRLTQCSFSDIHGHAVRVVGADEGSVEQCRIEGVDGTGIWATGGNVATLTSSKAVIAQNRISQVNRWKGAGGLGNGIYVSGVGLSVANNTITDSVELPWTMGIRVGGNNHVVERNRLSHVSYGDAGALYVGGRDLTARGNIVRFNVVEDCASGVYLDDRASGNTVTGNIITRAKATGIMIGGGQGNTVTKNVISSCGNLLRLDNRGMGWTALKHPFKDDFAKLQTTLHEQAKRALFFKAYPALAKVTEQNALLPLDNTVADNFAEETARAFKYDDMDHLHGGNQAAEYEKWNRIVEPRPITLPKNAPLDLTALGAPGLTSDRIGASASPASHEPKPAFFSR